MWIYIIITITIIAIISVIIIQNSLIKLDNKVEEAFSTIDIYLKKRWELIPNLVETVKGYAKHESSTLETIINLRNNNYNDTTINEKTRINNSLTNEINKLMVTVENYPDLKANENFKDLANQLTQIENDLVNARKYYNGVVRIYNNKVEMFPSNLVAKLFKYQTREMFEINNTERENVRINLKEQS